MATIYDFAPLDIDGRPHPLEAYRGEVLLVVNVASRCGFTPQYADLERLYRGYREQGFAVLGFPCDQFMHQEPGDADEIKQFCKLKYDVSFPLFAKIQVNGQGTHPLYRFLKSQQRGVLWTQAIKWNFTKFLVDRRGCVVRRYAPRTTVDRIEQDIQRLLAAPV